MATYIVLEPPVSASGGTDEADRLMFVRDGFSWGAFLIPVPWMLYRRLWIALCFYALFLVAVEFASRQFGAPTAAALGALGGLYLGFEGGALRRWALARRGFVETALVEAASRDEAEIRYFHGHGAVGSGEQPGPAPVAPSMRFVRPEPTAEIVGLFPTPGTAR
ncbi:DUF2628 domain-containing protein [Kaistia adipata]|uniref:DUF2628 domain-containing protein n=1 Tax=Kaistia adipata TaxID=166954 RepID=UPI0003F53DE8|nr:DUF2628 domain-containing protein [Kaistia adipata]